MNNIQLYKKNLVILISSLLACGFAIMLIGGRVVFVFFYNQDPIYELQNIPTDLPMLISGLMGLFYFVTKDKPSRIIFVSYILLLLVSLFGIILYFTQDDPLAFGLPMLLIVEPICLLVAACVTIVWIVKVTKK